MGAGLERLSLADLANFAAEAPDTPMHQGGLGILDGHNLLDAHGRVRIDDIRARLDARLNRVPELRRIFWRTRAFEGRPLWVDDPDFRIEEHVLVGKLPPPGGERGAIEYAEAAMTGLMDRTRPLWQLWLLEGYGQGEVGVFLKLHHTLADGMAILNILTLLFDLEPQVASEPAPPFTPEAPPTHWVLVRDNVARKRNLASRTGRLLAHPLAFLRSAALSVRGLSEALKEGRGAPRTSLNRPIGSSRRVAVLRLPLSEVKALAHSHGVKVNDVVLDLVASGLRQVLVSRGESIEGASIRASMAVHLPSSDRSAVVGNHAGSVIVRLPIDETDSVRRLARIGAATARAKRLQRGVVPQGLMVLLGVTGLTRRFIRRQNLVNVLVTNMAGPPFPLYIAGDRLLDAFAITPVAGNVTASFAALSYDGRLDLSVHVDAGAWPDLDTLVEGMRAGWHELTPASPLAA